MAMYRSANKVDDSNLIEPGPSEVHAIEFIAGLDSQLNYHGHTLEARLKSIPDAWRKYRCARRFTQDTIDALYSTLPNKTLLHMKRMIACGEIVIRPKPVTPVPNMQICEAADLKVIITTVLNAECSMCVRNATEARGCELRRALMRVTPAKSAHKQTVCPYRDVLIDSENNEYFGEGE